MPRKATVSVTPEDPQHDIKLYIGKLEDERDLSLALKLAKDEGVEHPSLRSPPDRLG